MFILQRKRNVSINELWNHYKCWNMTFWPQTHCTVCFLSISINYWHPTSDWLAQTLSLSPLVIYTHFIVLLTVLLYLLLHSLYGHYFLLSFLDINAFISIVFTYNSINSRFSKEWIKHANYIKEWYHNSLKDLKDVHRWHSGKKKKKTSRSKKFEVR